MQSKQQNEESLNYIGLNREYRFVVNLLHFKDKVITLQGSTETLLSVQ